MMNCYAVLFLPNCEEIARVVANKYIPFKGMVANVLMLTL
jgi:hypothetical protein